MIKRKNIDLSTDDIKTLTIEAVQKGTNFKNHIEEVLRKRAEKIRKANE